MENNLNTPIEAKMYATLEKMFEWTLRRPLKHIDSKDVSSNIYELGYSGDKRLIITTRIVKDKVYSNTYHLFAHFINPEWEGEELYPEPMVMEYRALNLGVDENGNLNDTSSVLSNESSDDNSESYNRLFGMVLDLCSVLEERSVRYNAPMYADLGFKHGYGSKQARKMIIKQDLFNKMLENNLIHCYDFYYPKWRTIWKLIKCKFIFWN